MAGDKLSGCRTARRGRASAPPRPGPVGPSARRRASARWGAGGTSRPRSTGPRPRRGGPAGRAFGRSSHGALRLLPSVTRSGDRRGPAGSERSAPGLSGRNGSRPASPRSPGAASCRSSAGSTASHRVAVPSAELFTDPVGHLGRCHQALNFVSVGEPSACARRNGRWTHHGEVNRCGVHPLHGQRTPGCHPGGGWHHLRLRHAGPGCPLPGQRQPGPPEPDPPGVRLVVAEPGHAEDRLGDTGGPWVGEHPERLDRLDPTDRAGGEQGRGVPGSRPPRREAGRPGRAMGIPHPVPVNVPVNARAPTLLVPGGLLSTATGCGPVQSSAPCGRDRNAMPTCPATVKFLDAQPEAHLLDPGSTMIGGVSGSRQQAAGSRQQAAGSGTISSRGRARRPSTPWPPRRHPWPPSTPGTGRGWRPRVASGRHLCARTPWPQQRGRRQRDPCVLRRRGQPCEGGGPGVSVGCEGSEQDDLRRHLHHRALHRPMTPVGRCVIGHPGGVAPRWQSALTRSGEPRATTSSRRDGAHG